MKVKTICTYHLTLGKSVENIQLGSSRNSIIQILGEPEKTIPHTLSIRDNYYGVGLSVEYRPADELCNHITVWHPAQLIYKGEDLLIMTWAEIVRWLGRLDSEAEAQGEGWASQKLGISVYPKWDHDGSFERVDFINVFDKQFYPSEEEMEAEFQREMAETPSEEECDEWLFGRFREPDEG
jgi:hypothetical protein